MSPAPAQCPVCRRSFTPTFTEESGRYKLCYCPGCGLGFFLPLEFPGPEYYETQHGVYAAMHDENTPISPWHAIFFRRPPEAGELLDIGCGNGSFMAAASRAGFRCRGIDFDRKSVEFARDTRGLTAEAVSVEEYARRGLRFDVATLFEVLEHQTDPVGFLKTARELLRPGGLLCGTVPNRTRLRWWPMEEGEFPPNHFLRWHRRSLKTCLEASGFSVVRLSSENLHSVKERLTGFAARWAKRRAAGAQPGAESASIQELAARGATPRAAGAMTALKRLRDGVFLPFDAAARFLDLGESLYFEARRVQ